MGIILLLFLLTGIFSSNLSIRIDGELNQQGWEEWATWGSCFCNANARIRTRYCRVRRAQWGSKCRGPRIQVESCDVGCRELAPSTSSTTTMTSPTMTLPQTVTSSTPMQSTTTSPSTCPFSCGDSAPSCGRRFLNVRKILGGESAKRGDWPWQGALWKPGRLVCGVTLICHSWVITAAHCFLDLKTGIFDYDDLELRLGSHHINATEVGNVRLQLRQDDVIIHPSFNSRRKAYDIALVRLNQPLKFNRLVAPACLPTLPVQPGSDCYATGWGNTKDIGPPNTYLKQLKVDVISSDVCSEVFSFSRTSSIICGGGIPNEDTCDGDSGGPLICQSEGRWRLEGITSFGARVCGTGLPTVFTKISHFLPWIQGNMENACAHWRFEQFFLNLGF